MTIRERADIKINKVSGTVSVCSHHALQHTNQRIVGAVSVLFVLRNHEEVNQVEEEINQQNSNSSFCGDINNIRHLSAVPASLSVVELPFGDVMNQIIGSQRIPGEDAQFQQDLYSMQQSLQNLNGSSFIGNNIKTSSVGNFDDLKGSYNKTEKVDGNDSEVSISKDLMCRVNTDDESFSIKEVIDEEECRENDRSIDHSKSPIVVERKTSLASKSDSKCFICNEQLDTYEKVLAHCKLHNLLKTCPICSFEFSGMKNNLKRHCLSHLQRPIYKCPHKTCTSTFGRKDNLRKHLMRHEHKMANPRLSLLHHKTQILKSNRRKPMSCYQLPTLVKMQSSIDRSFDFDEDDYENKTCYSNQSSLSEPYVGETDNGVGLSNCYTMKSTDIESSSTMSEDADEDHAKDENITIPPLQRTHSEDLIKENEFIIEKKTSIDSVISRISRKAPLPNDFAMDVKPNDFFNQIPGTVEQESGISKEKISCNSEENKVYIPHSQSQGGVVFPTRNADNFSQKYRHEKESNLNMEDLNASDNIYRSNLLDVSDDEQSHNSREDVLLDDSSHMAYTTVQTQMDLSLKCKYCSEPMESYVKIMDHIDDHKDEVRHWLTCVVCTSEFSSKDCLRRHARNHFGIKFKCSMCSNSYSRNDNLNKHMRESHGIDIRKKLRLK